MTKSDSIELPAPAPSDHESAGAAKVAPPTLDDASLSLPKSPNDPAFSERLQGLRRQFGDNRTEFNFMVCDALAQRGVAPNSNNVIKAGRWGSTGTAASDVRAWYAGIARRLAASQSRIPDAARGRANELIEQLWLMANELTAAPLNADIERLRQETAQSHDAAMQATHQMGAMQAEVGALKAKLTTALEQSARLEASLQVAQLAHTQEVSRLQFVASEVALTHKHELRQAEQAFAADLDAARQAAAAALSAEQERFTAAAKTHEGALTSLRGEIARLQDQIDTERKKIAMVLDQSRQDVREANARADQADQRATSERAEQNRLRDLNATAGIELARAEMQRDQAQEALRKMQEAPTPATVEEPPPAPAAAPTKKGQRA